MQFLLILQVKFQQKADLIITISAQLKQTQTFFISILSSFDVKLIIFKNISISCRFRVLGFFGALNGVDYHSCQKTRFFFLGGLKTLGAGNFLKLEILAAGHFMQDAKFRSKTRLDIWNSFITQIRGKGPKASLQGNHILIGVRNKEVRPRGGGHGTIYALLSETINKKM